MSKWARHVNLASSRSMMIQRQPFRPPLKKRFTCNRCDRVIEMLYSNLSPEALSMACSICLFNFGWYEHGTTVTCRDCRSAPTHASHIVSHVKAGLDSALGSSTNRKLN
jgi:transcription elongation factor Elf1